MTAACEGKAFFLNEAYLFADCTLLSPKKICLLLLAVADCHSDNTPAAVLAFKPR